MASIRRYKDKWRAFVRRKGISKTSVFATKREAQDWAANTEMLILSEAEGKTKHPFRDILIRYLDEVTPTKRGWVWEEFFIKRMLKNPLADKVEIDETDVVEYRNARLKEVQGASVGREMSLLSAICTTAIREWKWMEHNPFTNVKKPKKNPPRNRRVSDEEVEILKKVVGYTIPPTTSLQISVHAFMFAIETGMRAGEIQSLTWGNIDLGKRTAFIPMTKNGEPRTVPLSQRAIDLINELPRVSEYLFQQRSVKSSFWNAVNRAGIEDLRFHDSRHEAITRLAKKVDVLALARIVGHKRVNQLMTYYNESAEDIALKL